MTIIAPDGWYDIAKHLPPGLNGALELGGREPDTTEFCPGGRPTGLSSESEDAIKALLSRVEKSLETD